MKILINANAVWNGTGYGTQSSGMARAFRELGHEVALAPNYGLAGGRLQVDGMKCYPPAFGDQFGIELLGEHAKDFEADLIVTLYDMWPLPAGFGDKLKVPWLAYFPVHGSPVEPKVVDVACSARYPTVFSKFGLQQTKEAGLDCFYVPHGINTEVFKPGDRHAAREKLGLPQDKFIALIAGVNRLDFIPSRKALPEQITAFAEFHKNHPDTALYLHTNLTGPQTLDLNPLMTHLRLRWQVYNSDQYSVQAGIDDTEMATIYQACDVLLGASYAEGFGLPILEAQACGMPVITNQCSAMPELTLYGQVVEPAQKVWSPLGSWWHPPSIQALEWALHQVYNASRNVYPYVKTISGNQADALVKIQQEYAWPVVRDNHWKPLLDRIEGEVKSGYKPVDVIGPVHVNGADLMIADTAESITRQTVEWELRQDQYGLNRIDFKDGDWVVDIGAHVGIVSCYLGRQYPKLRILAVEPEPTNYKHLLENLKRNRITNVTPVNCAVSKDGRQMAIALPSTNTGGACTYLKPNGFATSTVCSMPLDELFETYKIDRCKLLKIDCEGGEFEALHGSPVLDKIEYLSGEFHMNGVLSNAGYSLEGLMKELTAHIPPKNIAYQLIPIMD